jgi:hypothetical protein
MVCDVSNVQQIFVFSSSPIIQGTSLYQYSKSLPTLIGAAPVVKHGF